MEVFSAEPRGIRQGLFPPVIGLLYRKVAKVLYNLCKRDISPRRFACHSFVTQQSCGYQKTNLALLGISLLPQQGYGELDPERLKTGLQLFILFASPCKWLYPFHHLYFISCLEHISKLSNNHRLERFSAFLIPHNPMPFSTSGCL